jgi:hypothetical protein
MATERQIAANRTNEKKHWSQNRGGQVEGEPQRLRRRQKPMPSRTSWPASRPATRSGWRNRGGAGAARPAAHPRGARPAAG